MNRVRILIVEDHEKNMKLMRDILQVSGYETLEAETGEQAIRMAQVSKPDLILMDIQLPGIDGFEAFDALRKDSRTCDIPVIAVTASVMTEEREHIDAVGFDGFQSKPINVRAFLKIIKEVLERKEFGH